LYAKVQDSRIDALSAYRADVLARLYPGDAETAGIDDSELAEFAARLKTGDPKSS
jgi:hypothetical protein